jgi:DNA uptake protein ComE-like DNA-binding protein
MAVALRAGMRKLILIALLPIFTLTAACSMGLDDGTDDPSSIAISLPAGDAARVLDLVNYPGTDVGLLDTIVGLDTRAAENIIAYRNGADGIAPSGDDQLFEDIAELDAIAYVGDSAFTKLTEYATANPAPSAESVEGVLFLGWESEAVVWGVNQATIEELDVEAGLELRAAESLIGHAGAFTSVTEMGPVTWVGGVALQMLRAHARVWWLQMRGEGQGGTFDGVSFDDQTAVTAIDIANLATVEQMVTHGVRRAGAEAIVAAGPYTSLAQVAAVEGVGTATMQQLHDYAASGTW